MIGPAPLDESDLVTLRKLRVRSLATAQKTWWPWSWWHSVNASIFEKLIEYVEREGRY